MSLEALCQSCALCCDGTLFTLVPLQPDDRLDAASRLTVIEKANGARALRQPCTALEGSRCTEYAQRPFACRRFECLLFEALRSDEVSLAGALELVERAKALVADVQPNLEAARRETPPSDALARAEAFLRFHFTGHRRTG